MNLTLKTSLGVIDLITEKIVELRLTVKTMEKSGIFFITSASSFWF